MLLSLVHTEKIEVTKAIRNCGLRPIFLSESYDKLLSMSAIPSKYVLCIDDITKLECISHNISVARNCIVMQPITTARMLGVNTPIKFLDCYLPFQSSIYGSIVIFSDLSINKLFSYLTLKRRRRIESIIVIADNKVTQYGKFSSFKQIMTDFLLTLPTYVWEPTLVAFVTGFVTNKSSTFSRYLNENRLVTNQNRSLLETISEIMHHWVGKQHLLLSKDPKEKMLLTGYYSNDKVIRSSSSGIKSYVFMYNNKKLEDYLDVEENVNVTNKLY